MFASAAFVPALLAAAMQISIPFGPKPRTVEQARAPIERLGPRWVEECGGSTDWNTPGPPVRVHGNAYYVGTCGISAMLITGSDGHILIDSGTEQGAEIVAENIRRLGFRLGDIKFLLHSHEHFDHVAGMARLQQLTGATLVASAPAARVFATGAPGGDDPQAGMHPPFPAANVGRIVKDGDQIRLGDLMLTAIATPGHTPGGLSWRWVSCDGGVCRTIVFADSLNPISRDDYRFSDHPAYVAEFRKSLARMAASDCEIIVSAHPSASALEKRFAAGKTLLDTEGCKAYSEQLSKLLDERLAKEAAARK